MAGEAKTNAFMLSSATVMIGPQADLFDLNPTEHSIGLVKNFQMTAEPTYTELTQGVQNTIVYSVLTNNPVKCSMEVYEYTSKNLMYGLGLDGSAVVAGTRYQLKTAISSGGTAVVMKAATDVSGSFLAADWIMLQNQSQDGVHIGQLASNSTWDDPTDALSLTLTAGTTIDTDLDFAVDDLVMKVTRIDVGSKLAQPYLAAKIVSVMPDQNTPVTILIPKLRVTRGFTLNFSSEQFSNLPFEFTPYEVVSTDPNYSLFANRGVASIFSGY